MKIHIRFNVILLLTAAALLVAGCGASNDRFSAERTGDVTSEGILLCYQCHNDTDNPAGLEIVFGNSPASIANGLGWLAGRHGNTNNAPSFSWGSWEDSVCGVCHDQLGNGRTIEDFYLKTGDDSLGTADRPVIACESCHGSGQGHMSVATPGPDVCGQCHNEKFPHSNPEGRNITAMYKTSPHANSTLLFGLNICSRCHTNEGAQAYIGLVNGTESASEISLALKTQSDIEDPSVVQCATCHEAHTTQLLGELSDAGDGTWSDQYKTCTSCHQLYDETGAVNDSAYHTGWEPDVLITDTHYEIPGTTDIGGDFIVEGYIVNATISHSRSLGNSNGGVCLDCHNPHNADNAINRQWANSAHGGFILQTADPVTGVGNVTASDAPAWTSQFVGIGPGAVCTRCHTSTGFRNFANDPAMYDANNDVLPGGDAHEMLYCWACHVNNVGGFRNPGVFNSTIAAYTSVDPIYNTPAGRIEAVGDLNGSNICMSCHKARRTGESIKEVNGTSVTYNSLDGHYLAAGAILFRTGGYEFTNSIGGLPLIYNNPSFFHHKDIGSSAYPETGNNGPCVGCHMEDSDVGHTLEVVEKDADGVIVGLPANDQICSNCHAGAYELTADEVEEQSEGFRNALLALSWKLHDMAVSQGKSIFNAVGMDFSTPYTSADLNDLSFPYFGGFGAANWSTATDLTGRNNLGAAFNFSLLVHELGAFVHNRFYTKRLIFDSIDWADGDTVGLDGEIMDGTIDLSAFPVAAEWYQEDGSVINDNSVARP